MNDSSKSSVFRGKTTTGGKPRRKRRDGRCLIEDWFRRKATSRDRCYVILPERHCNNVLRVEQVTLVKLVW